MGTVIRLEVCPTDTILNVKRYLMDEFYRKIVPEQQNLISSGKRLENQRTLSDYHLQEGATLILVLRVRAGVGWVGESL